MFKFGKRIYSILKTLIGSVPALISRFFEPYTTLRATFFLNLPFENNTVGLMQLSELILSDLPLY